VPIGLRNELEVGADSLDPDDRLVPELARHPLIELRIRQQWIPQVSDAIFQHEHRHIATHAVGVAADSLEHLDHLDPESCIRIVELSCVVPRREVRIATKRNYLTGFVKEELAGGLAARFGVAAYE